VASALSAGGYEFLSISALGVVHTVRWMLQPSDGADRVPISCEVNNPRPASTKGPASDSSHFSTPCFSKQFRCSMFVSSSRQHRILAHLTSSAIEIREFFEHHSSTRGSPPVDSRTSGGALAGECMSLSIPMIYTLTTATAMLIALSEGWVSQTRGIRPFVSCNPRKAQAPLNSLRIRKARGSTANAPSNTGEEDIAKSKPGIWRRVLHRKMN
jgi:hypothetical protein